MTTRRPPAQFEGPRAIVTIQMVMSSALTSQASSSSASPPRASERKSTLRFSSPALDLCREGRLALRIERRNGTHASVLECGCPLPLWLFGEGLAIQRELDYNQS